MNKVFRTAPVDNGMTAVLCGENVFVALYDKTGAEILAIQLNRIVEDAKAAESLPAPEAV